MTGADEKFRLNLLGPFRLSGPGGGRIDVPSKKGVALIAMLAMSNQGERTRSWLQDRLWGSREPSQAQGSLRRELSSLRRRLNAGSEPLLVCSHDRVKLDLDRLQIDVRDSSEGDSPGGASLIAGEFLEGLDVAAAEGFEAWLREQRSRLADRRGEQRAPGAAGRSPESPLPDRIVNVSTPAPGFAGRPAIAVLPFRNQTGEPDNDYLAEGLSEDVIDRLSRLRWLPVIARSSSFSFSGDVIDHHVVGQRLGAKYLLEGRLRSSGQGYVLAVDLIDASVRQVLWSHRLESASVLSEPARSQLTAELVGVLGVNIDHAEQASARAKSPQDLSINELIWRGRWHFNRLTREDAEKARTLFAEALAREPNSSEALVQVTWAMERSLWAQRGSPAQIREMRALAQKVISLDSDDARGYMLAGIAELWLRRPLRAKGLLSHAIHLNPSLTTAHANLGSTYNLSGEPEAALGPLTTALRLSPNDQEVFFLLGEIAMAHSLLGHWAQAIDFAEQSLVRRNAYWYAHVLKINALARSGDVPAAREALDDLMAVRPGFSESYIDWLPFSDPARAAHFKDGLALAASH